MIQDHDHFMSSLVVILGKLGIIQLKVISKKNELLKYDSPWSKLALKLDCEIQMMEKDDTLNWF